MRVRCISVLFICALCLLLIQIPTIRAGSLIVAPGTLYGTTISFSASYPDFHFDEPTNISLTISVTFNNASVSAVNITAIHVRLYYSSVNMSQVVGDSPPLGDAYAWANWFSTDYYDGLSHSATIPYPHKIQRFSAEATSGSWDVNPLTFTYLSILDKEVQARLYVQITFCFLDANGNTIWRQGANIWQVGYHWYLYTGEGEAPYVTIYAKAQQQSWLFRPDIIALVLVLVGLALVITAVIVLRKKRTKTLKKDTYPPPPSQPTSQF